MGVNDSGDFNYESIPINLQVEETIPSCSFQEKEPQGSQEL